MADTTKVREALKEARAYIVNTDAMERCGLPPSGCKNDVCVCVEQHSAVLRNVDAALAALDSAAQEDAGPVAPMVRDPLPFIPWSKEAEMRESWAHPSPSGPVAIPDGWQLVPKVATERMNAAGVYAGVNASPDRWFPKAWAAALAAAPVPSAHDAEGKVDDAMVERACAGASKAAEISFDQRHVIRGALEAALRNRPCPYVHSSGEGTHYCTLPHAAEKELAELRKRIDEAPRGMVRGFMLEPETQPGWLDKMGGKRVAIVPLREGE